MIEEKLTNHRIVFLNDEVNKDSAIQIIKTLLYLDSINTDDIYLYINSPGGDVHEGLSIIDCMNYIKSNVITICIGKAYSMGAIILTCGKKRYALPNSEIMIHQPLSSISGKAQEIEATSKRINLVKNNLAKIISTQTKKSLKVVLNDMKEDYFMSSLEAKKYGLIDNIINQK